MQKRTLKTRSRPALEKSRSGRAEAKYERRQSWGPWLIAALFLLISLLHLWHLSDVPRGLYIDESSIGINAASVAATGHDEHGVFFPLYFKAFGEWKNPLYVYLTAIIFRAFGVSELTLRLTSFLFFLAFLFGFYFLLRSLFKDDVITIMYGVAAAGFLPWFFALSRVAFEVVSQLTATVFFLLLAFHTFHGTKQRRWYIFPFLAGLSLGISTYAYSTARLLSVFFFVILALLYFGKRHIGPLLTSLTGLLITLIPYFLFSLRNPGALTHRFKLISYLYEPSLTAPEKLLEFLKNYFHYLSPSYLFLTGDSQLRHHTGHGGELFLTVGVLALVGLASLFTEKNTLIPDRRFLLFVVLGALLSPIAAALTPGDSSLRSILVGLFLVLLSSYGFRFLQQLRHGLRALVVAVVFVSLLIEIAYYTGYYFTRYPKETITAFESYDFHRALDAAVAEHPSNIVVSGMANQPYVHLEFYRQLVLNPDHIPMNVDIPVAQSGRCIVYFPSINGVLGEQGFTMKQVDVGENFTSLRCYGPYLGR